MKFIFPSYANSSTNQKDSSQTYKSQIQKKKKKRLTTLQSEHLAYSIQQILKPNHPGLGTKIHCLILVEEPNPENKTKKSQMSKFITNYTESHIK